MLKLILLILLLFVPEQCQNLSKYMLKSFHIYTYIFAYIYIYIYICIYRDLRGVSKQTLKTTIYITKHTNNTDNTKLYFRKLDIPTHRNLMPVL